MNRTAALAMVVLISNVARAQDEEMAAPGVESLPGESAQPAAPTEAQTSPPAAQPEAAPPAAAAPGEEKHIFNLRFGAKGTITGLLWNKPDNQPPQDVDAFWGKTQFYYGGGGGLFVEGNVFGYLGLEVDFLFESNSLTFNYTYNNFEYDYYTRFSQFRIPILIKGTLPLGDIAELSLGLGPEFAIGTSAKVDAERRTNTGIAALNQQADDMLAAMYDAKKQGGTFFDLDLGINFKVWKLVIPFDLRAGFNLSQPADYDKRVTLGSTVVQNQVFPTGEVKAVESMHFAALIGVGYLLPL